MIYTPTRQVEVVTIFSQNSYPVASSRLVEHKTRGPEQVNKGLGVGSCHKVCFIVQCDYLCVFKGSVVAHRFGLSRRTVQIIKSICPWEITLTNVQFECRSVAPRRDWSCSCFCFGVWQSIINYGAYHCMYTRRLFHCLSNPQSKCVVMN